MPSTIRQTVSTIVLSFALLSRALWGATHHASNRPSLWGSLRRQRPFRSARRGRAGRQYDSPQPTIRRTLAALVVLSLLALAHLPSARAASWSAWSPLLDSLTYNAPTAALGCAQIHLFDVGSDHHIYSRTYDGISWSGWVSLGGPPPSGVTYTDLTATFYTQPMGGDNWVGQLYLFAIGTDRHIYDDVFDCSTWSGWHLVGGTTYFAPTATQFGFNLDLFAVDSNNPYLGPFHVYEMSYPSVLYGSTWSSWWPVGGSVSTASATTVYNGQDYLFVVGSDHQVYDNLSVDGYHWPGWFGISSTTYYAPAATACGRALHLFAVSTGHQIDESIGTDATGSVWSTWSTIGNLTTSNAPAATCYNGTVYLFGVDTNHHINWITFS